MCLMVTSTMPPGVELRYKLIHHCGTDDERGESFQSVSLLASRLSGVRSPLVLRLSRASLLEVTIWLPKAAERDLEQLLIFELDALTPFSSEDIYWVWKVVGRDKALRKLAVRVSVIERSGVDAILLPLAVAGIVPRALEVMDEGEQETVGGLRVFPLSRVHGNGAVDKRVRLRAAVLVAVFLATAAAMPFFHLYQVKLQTETSISSLRHELAEEERLRRLIGSQAATVNAARTAREQAVNLVAILARLSAALPDDTFLNELSIHGRTLAATGESGAAPKLLFLLSAEPGFSSPVFTSSVIRNGAGTADEFSLRLEVGP